MEHGYRREIVVAIAAEAIAILSLGILLAVADRRVRELRDEILAPDETGNPSSTPSATEA